MWSFIVASMWLVFERSDSSGWVGTVTFASMIPMLIVSPVGGLLSDTMDRRTLAVATMTGSAVVVATLAVLALADVVQLWHVAVLALAAGAGRATQEPAIQALIPNQVPRDELLNALVLNGAARHGARFFGLLVASPLLRLSFVGVKGVLVLSALFHAIGAIQMARIRTRSSGETSPEQGLLRNMLEGLVYIYNHYRIAVFVILVALHCALTMSFESMLPILSREELGATDGSVVGYLVMGFGAGALLAISVLAGVRNERRQGQLLIWTGLASGVTPMLLALSKDVPVAVLCAAGMGASQATFMALSNTYVQMMIPDRLRGRISSLYALHAGGIMAFANLGYGFMADIFSAPPILFITGAIFVAVMVGMGVGQPIIRSVYRTGRVVPAEAS